MVSKKTAIKPDVFNLPTLRKQEELDKRGITDEERFLYGMGETSGFPIFTRIKDDLLRELDMFQEAAIINGRSKEEIGDNAILISMVKGIINRLWNKIADAKEVCEQGTGGP